MGLLRLYFLLFRFLLGFLFRLLVLRFRFSRLLGFGFASAFLGFGLLRFGRFYLIVYRCCLRCYVGSCGFLFLLVVQGFFGFGQRLACLDGLHGTVGVMIVLLELLMHLAQLVLLVADGSHDLAATQAVGIDLLRLCLHSHALSATGLALLAFGLAFLFLGLHISGFLISLCIQDCVNNHLRGEGFLDFSAHFLGCFSQFIER